METSKAVVSGAIALCGAPFEPRALSCSYPPVRSESEFWVFMQRPFSCLCTHRYGSQLFFLNFLPVYTNRELFTCLSYESSKIPSRAFFAVDRPWVSDAVAVLEFHLNLSCIVLRRVVFTQQPLYHVTVFLEYVQFDMIKCRCIRNNI